MSRAPLARVRPGRAVYSAPMRIERVTEPGAEWDAFVESVPGATLGHAAAWAGVARAAYGLEPVFLAARNAAGALRGVLPLVRFVTLAGAREVVSMPFLDAAGILAVDDVAEAALRDAALGEARAFGARAVELRQWAPLRTGPEAPACGRLDLVLALPAGEEALWTSLPAKVRNQTRKASREGLVCADEGEPGLVADFYAPFRVNMRDLGSPVHARAFYEAIASAFGPRVRFVVVRDAQRPVGGLVAIRYAGLVTVPWASTLRSERSRCPNNLLYWEALRWAIRGGARAFDFGRSPPGSGTHRFKLGWGASAWPLAWLRLAPSGELLPEPAGAGGDTLRRLASLWSRLPVPLASALGPRLRRRLAQ
ncbi:MAG: GNAT family N-acetyltransferase [Deltaproteobacteria bacterium]|nr:GNAT family N-acetyltransferase [Deltaproteobacteria bacterium]